MEFSHRPVLLNECLENLKIKPDGIYVDGTLGGAGHANGIYKQLDKDGTLLGIDQDSDALEHSNEILKSTSGKAKIILAKSNFKNIKKVCNENGITKVDGILLDLGVSSYQLDEPERGFSYMNNAPLDMRMDKDLEITAETIVNEYSKENIKEIIRNYGEERWASRIAEFIVIAREKNHIDTTWELVEIIKAAIPSSARRDGPHPAKRTFQALRIEVNNELGILKDAIEDSISTLKSGGRFCIITFHSLEDRIVKNEFNRAIDPCTCPHDFPICVCKRKPTAKHITRKPIIPTKEELDENPRSRSAKLRVIERM